MEKREQLQNEELLREQEELFALLLAEEGFAPVQTSTIPAREQTKDLPLSFTQERLWFLDQWEPQGTAYNMFSGLRLRGTLEVNTLQRSLHALVQRHEGLRTTFLATNGQPVQVIAPWQPTPLPVVDLGRLSPDEQEAQLQHLAQQEAQLPFDLSRGPLLRATLLRVHQHEHVFLLTQHHIISDGWSLGVFNRELGALYEAFSQEQPSPLPPLPIQYADFALWQRQRLQGEALEELVRYWKNQLQGAPALLNLPTDRPRPPVQTFVGSTHQVEVSAELTHALRTLAQRESVTLFTVLLATLQTLLMRYSQQENFCIGTYIAGRTHIEIEQLVGYFINNLALRTDLSGDPSFREALRRASQVMQGAYAHQELPFEVLLQELQVERTPRHTPLFQVMLIYQNMPWHSITLPGLTISPLEMERKRADFDLSLWVIEGPQELYLTFAYNTDLFDATTIQRLAGHFQRLLQAAVEDPDQSVWEMPLLSAGEQQQMLASGLVRADDAKTVAGDFASLFAAQAVSTPDAIAVVCEDQHLTYGDLLWRVERLAAYLQGHGVGPEVTVGLYLDRSLEAILGLLSILRAGGIYVPLDPGWPGERLAFILRDTQMSLLLTRQSLLAHLPRMPVACVCLDTDWPAIITTRELPQQNTPWFEQLAYVIHTSGSTGQPKGVGITRRSLDHFTSAAGRLLGIEPGDRVLQFASLSFDASLEEIAPCLSGGGTLCVRSESMLSDPHRFLQTCAMWGVSVLDLPTAYWHELALDLDREEITLPASLRLVIIGGEKAQAQALAMWRRHTGEHVRLVNTYGPTEATVVASAHWVERKEAGRAREEAVIGRALPHAQTYVLDRHLQPVPIGVPGELYIGGAGVARGYLHRPDLTAERFVPHPFSQQPGARLYRTGDLARCLAGGELEFWGRVDSQVKIRGYRIEPGEIEAVLARHPLVRETVVLAREDAPGDKRLVAYVVSGQEIQEPGDRAAIAAELRAYLQQSLPAYLLPGAFVLLDAFPRGTSGKVNRRVLPVPEQRGEELAGSWEAPRTPTEELLANLWTQVLRIEQVGRHDHFFHLGGHSLLATQLVARLRQVLGVEVSLRAIFDLPTLAGLAREIDTTRLSQQPLPMPPLLPHTHRGEAPLSYAQQRLWFLDQLQPESSAYNIALTLELSGQLNIATLECCFQELARRHEGLRTAIVMRDGRPMQLIASSGQIPLLLLDISLLNEEAREQELDRLAQQEAQRPFDLTQGSLMRTTLIRLEEERHVLLLTMHHIITDAWSMGVLLRELAALYRARVQGTIANLPVSSIQYADYALWQRQWLEGWQEDNGQGGSEGTSPLEQQLVYWQQQLAGAPALLELPIDHPRPQVQTFRGAHYVFPISPPLLAGLRQLSRQEGTTSFMTLLAAFVAVLARYSGQEDIVVGTPIANRMRAEVEGVLGFFVNTLALRLDLSGNLSIRELLKQVREVALEAYAHQDLPFERLVDALHPQRDLSYTPLFQVIFALQNVTTAVLDLPELTVVSLPVESGIARFDLTLTVQESQQEMLGILEYNLDMFEPATIQRLAGHFQTLLQAMVARPAQRLADLPLLTGAERQQLLVEWNATQSSYPQDQCLSALFEKQVEYAPEAIALVCGEHQLTYGELNARATRLAQYLHQLGVRSETLVGVALERSLELVIGLLAIIKAGGAYVPLDLSYPAERLAFMLADANITLLLTQEHLQSRFSTHETLRLLCLDRDWPIIAQQLPERPLRETSADSLGYVIYTSGSTGQPKGVAVQQRSIVRLVCGTDYVPLDARQTLLQLAPISFDAATFELWGALLQGGRCVLVRADMPGVQQLGELLKQEAISILWLTASLFNVVVDEAPEILTGLRHLLVGGEALSVSHVRRGLEALPGVRLINGYGPTENTTFSCCYPIERPLPTSMRSIPIGRPIANSQAYVLDRRGEPVPVGVTGELYLGGAGLARGYLGRPDLTAERFVPHPFSSEPGARLYRTGDRVRSRVDGTLEFLGRDDQQVKLRGFRIELEEIETILLQHPAIQEAVALLHEESPGEKRLVAYIVTQQQIPVVISDLRHYVQDRLPDYMVPAAFVLLEALPLTPNGKLDRRALPTPQRSRPAQDSVEMAPRTPEEELLVAIWTQLLGIEQVGIHDNFFELGGDSILSIQVVARATAAGLPLTPRHLFQHQTIARLAAVFGLAATAPAAQAEQKVVSGPLLLTPIHHWFFQQSLPEPQHWNQARIVQLRQPLTPAVLEQALHILLVHHDALRLRVRSNPEGWQLFHALSDERVPLMCIDLTDLPQAQQRTALEAAATALQASLDLNQGPIVCAALFDLGSSQPARLLLVIHHLAVDIVSWPILLEDIQTACQQLSQGQPVRLPPKTTSYQHWAERLSEYAQSPAVQAQLDYWLAQRWQAVRPLPLDMPAGRAANSEASARTVVMALSVEETQALLSEVPRAYHTHINEVLLTALVQAFARWTGTPSLLLHLEGHGREDLLEGVDLSRTVGWFTSLTPLVLTLADKPGAGEALKSIKEQVRHVPQGGVGFGLLRYLSQQATIRERLAALPLPEVSFNYGGRTAFVLSREEGLFAPAVESAGAMHSLRGQRPHILDINSGIVDGRLFVEWTYSESLHHSATIERLTHFYQDSLQSLIRHCQSPQAGGYTPSDFPDAELSQGALDTLIAHLANAATREEDGLLRVDLEAIYPLSPMQEGILFHSLYSPQSEVYFEQFTYTLRGNLDVPAFKAAWQRVVARHPILRTLFLWENLEKPLQVVRKQVELSWSEYDWRHLRSEEQDERLQAWLQADRAQGFDLGRAPLLRLGLIQLGERTYRFTWSFHHLLLDGWSVFTVLGEVFAYHEATCQGRTLTLPPGRPYRDYIAWLQQQDLFPAETFWRETLRGFTTPTLDMHRAIHREVELVENYHHYVFRISETTTADLQTLARQQQLTLNTLVQGAWALLLARYSGQQDVVFGATVSGRPTAQAGVESMVGLFINTLPLRVQVAPRQPLLPWLQELQARQAEARQYEYSPLAQIQGWSEVPRGQPLFDSLLVFENYPVDASAMRESSLEIEIVQVVERTNYPLTVTVLPGARLSIRLSYMGGRFDAPTIERLSQHFQMLLEDMVTHPEQQLIDLPLLTRAEQAQLRDWNATEMEYPRDVCLQELFEAQVERTPEAIALIYEEQQLTYGELNARANRLAHFLQRLGVGPEVLVGLYLDRSLDFMVGLLGVLKAGGAYVPLDPGYPAERLSFLLQDARIPLLLTQQQHMVRLPEHKARVVSLDSDWSTIEPESAEHVTSGAQPEYLAYVIYTSGSTGQPKGVLGIYRATINRLHWMWERFPFEAEEVYCQKTSISFVDSIWEMLGPLLQGIPTVIIPDEIVKDPHRLAYTLAERRVTRIVTVPSLLQAVLDTGLDLQTLLSRVKYWVSSGEALSVDLAAHFLSRMPQSALINLYGSSEVAADATCYLVESCQALTGVPIGHPIANTQVYLLDAHMQPVPIGAVGELCIGGANLSRGYLYRPDMTAEKFLPHPFSHEPGARLYHTGDLARYLSDGNLEILGRIDTQVKVRGYRIELGEIEATLARHPAVGAAVVVMREDEPGDKRLIAYVVPREAEVGQVVLARETEPADLRTFLRGKMPEYMLPSAVVRLSALPLLPSGKVDRRILILLRRPTFAHSGAGGTISLTG